MRQIGAEGWVNGQWCLSPSAHRPQAHRKQQCQAQRTANSPFGPSPDTVLGLRPWGVCAVLGWWCMKSQATEGKGMKREMAEGNGSKAFAPV